MYSLLARKGIPFSSLEIKVLITAWGQTKLQRPHSIQFSFIHLGARVLTCLFSSLLRPVGNVPVFRLATSLKVN